MAKSRGKSRPTIDLQAGSDTGSSSKDNLTSDTTLSLSGKAEPGARLSIFDGSTLLGTVKARRDGTWSFTGPELAEGEHVLTVVVRDGGSKVTSKPLTVTVDTTAPDAPGLTLDAGSDTGSDATDGITSDTTPTLTGTAEARAVIVISNGATVLGTTTADAKGAWSFTVGALGESDHSLTATATDRAGNVGTAPVTLALTIDTTAPVAPTIDLDAASDTGTSATDNVTNDTTPRLTGTAEAGATVTIIINGSTVLGTAVADASGAWSFTSSALAEGVHSITAQAEDSAGNAGDWSSDLSVTIDASSATPTLAVAAASDTGISSTDGITADTTPTLTGTAEAGATVTIKDGATLLGTAVADGTGSWSFTTGTLSTGSHSLTATATDLAGNASATSAPVVVTVDTTAPGTATIDLAAASDTGTSSTDKLTSDTTPTLTGTAEAGATVTIKDGTVLLGTTTADSTGAWSFTTGVLAAGGRLLTATASDAAGNTGATSSNVAVTIDPYAPSTPTIDLDAGSDTGSSTTDHVTSDTTPTVSGTAEGGTTITIYNGTTVLGTTTADSLTGAWSFTPTALPAGSYALTATATDSAGNISSASSILAVLVDTTAPAAPGIGLAATSDTGISATDAVTSDTAPTLTGTTEAGATVTIREGSDVLGTVTADSSGVWSFTTALSEGSHVLRAIATDLAGNIGSESSLMVEIDTSAPAAPTIDLDAASDSGRSSVDDVTSNATPTLSGSAAAGATVTIYRNSVVFGTTVADMGGAWSFTPSSLSAGSHAFTATATDAAGNEGAASSILAVLIDRTAPSAPVISLDAASDTGTSSSDALTSDATPTLTGTAEAAAIITIRDGSTVLGTTTADGSGAWSFTSSALSEGSHSLTATATDVAGNTGAASASITFEIDTTAPAAPVIGLTAASDTGRDTADAVTSDTSPTLTGTTEAGATITIMDGSAVLGTATADSTGAWSFTTALSEGSHSLTATATDVAGNTGSASSIMVEIDTAAPAAPTIELDATSDTGTSSSDGQTSDAEPLMTGTAEAGATVTIFDGTTILGTTVADGTGAWSFVTPTLSDGAHSLTAAATDAAGNVSTASGAAALTVTRALYNLAALGSSDGYVLLGGMGDRAGIGLGGGGDVNGDGLVDLIVGSDFDQKGGGVFAGEAYVIYGGQNPGNISLDSLTAAQGFVIQGDSYNQVGYSVDSAGDVNGDGYDDVIIGAPGAKQAFVVFGSSAGIGTLVNGRNVLDLTTLSASEGYVIQGSGSQTGTSVSSAGDINGDGLDDIIVGGGWANASYVIFGSTDTLGTTDSGRQVVHLSSLSSPSGFTIRGGSGDSAGFAVSTAGDVNGDGFEDIIVGNDMGDDGGTDAGEAYVIFGTSSGFGNTIDLDTLSSSQGFVIQGDVGGDWAGRSVSSGGDVNGDGHDDVIVGAYGASNFAGEAYVLFGKAATFGTLIGGRDVLDITGLDPEDGFVIKGDNIEDFAGTSVSSGGDFNGDGYDDMLIGATWGDDGNWNAGEAYLIFGSADGFGTEIAGRQVVDLTTLTAAQGFIIQGYESAANTGYAVSAAGDINGDGLDDIVVGAPQGGGGNGQAYVIYGNALGDTAASVSLSGTSGADDLVGGLGDDTIAGNGGADVLIGGGGDDTISVASADFRRISGGGGTDTLVCDGAGISIDFTQIANSRISGIERLDLSGTGNNTVKLAIGDIFKFSDTIAEGFTAVTLDEALVVDGNAGDTLQLVEGTGSWTIVSSSVGLDGSANGNFDIYEYTLSGDVRGFLAVDSDVGVTLI